MVTDGVSNTILVGEKQRDPTNLGTAGDDNNTAFVGHDNDNARFTSGSPQPDMAGADYTNYFGGPHPGGAYFVFGDGAVRKIVYAVDSTTFAHLGSRADHVPVDPNKFEAK
jgi:prepilin-type processing-associated H-X9-DG protein